MNCLAPRGQFTRAAEELEIATELDPVSPAISTSLGVLDFFEGNYASAISRFQAVLEKDDAFYLARYFLGQTYNETGRQDDAIRELERAAGLTRRSAESVSALGYALAMSGRHPEALLALHELSDRAARSYVSPVLLAQVQIGLGQMDEAICNLRKAFHLRSADLIWLELRPALRKIGSTDAALEILRGMGLRAKHNEANA